MMKPLKVKLWLQHPPKVMWVLRVISNTERGDAIVRAWFPEYTSGEPPPVEVVQPVALICARIALAATAQEIPVDGKFSVEIRQ